jgi:hypothetical protein
MFQHWKAVILFPVSVDHHLLDAYAARILSVMLWSFAEVSLPSEPLNHILEAQWI